ncbi:hypothetical protein [Desulfatitalea alkaliphila]|uniref:Uncharacterized protein n=1 Tax=Desulfatitalea alkaliphila TaxID=2929485 RepID=A0AA41QZT9_9BACT|nr:hypothetical protein [Desulfatitalea alkaliphila]MCJ8499354.1 hypothetical protein [Desulfatitalea alkaliphila]
MDHMPHARRWLGAILLLIIGLPVGCAKPPIVAPNRPEPVPAREWMYQESGAHINEAGPVFYGIGMAAGVRNTTLLRAAADNEARTEMGRILRAYINALGTEAGLDSEVNGDAQLLGTLSRNALQRARIVDHWRDDSDGNFKALCHLELAQLKKLIEAEFQLNPAQRAKMLQMADTVHQRMTARRGP